MKIKRSLTLLFKVWQDTFPTESFVYRLCNMYVTLKNWSFQSI